ncbi:MAG: hypothetical protein ACOCTI_08880, partial [Phycisphaeraceae bacterium]
MKAFLSIVAAAAAIAAADVARAHETDPYTIPPGREFADLGDRFTFWAYDAVEQGVEDTNAKIRKALAAEDHGRVRELQRPRAIAEAVNGHFPDAYSLIEGLERELYTRKVRERHPGKVVAHKEVLFNSYLGIYLPIDPRQLFRLWFASNIKAFGVYLGTDKIGHFTDMGIRYYRKYDDTLAAGGSEEEAVAAALDLGTDHPLLSEAGLLGYVSAGEYSNGDLAANYLGMKFYRNLTEPVMLKGETRPPMLERSGAYWRIAEHVGPETDFFGWFISDHMDEALNPGHFEALLRKGVARAMRDRAEEILWRYRDEHGRRRPPAWFDNRLRELATYHGEAYGHRGPADELL